ncbi:Methyltransferase small domain protein [Paenibacillus konkukensis]|uniref:Methyltransferase small domain protein n=1 Tax=Paenibacillus konkukensis TaxID=2020716 RepID=A0ABY4RGB9_9BACL|nr:methyltransferase domain-containing protein [Paenibacillus konkukensis]UQZ81516.1 Methyltransferase small domain protein [Paenibacillus konkukensis]
MNANLPSAALEKVKFFYKFIRTPRTIGSVTPSSRYLTGKMIEPVPWQHIDSIAELGCGTGVITKAIHQKMKPGTAALLFEKDSYLRKQLAEQYPDSSTYADAQSLGFAVRQEGLEHLDCIVSGLPFANFPQTFRDSLIEQVHRCLKPGGYFIAFQYSLQMKKQLSRDFEIESIRFVMRNVPPAFVYVCRKKDADR